MLNCTRGLVLALTIALAAVAPVWCAGDSPSYCQRDALNTEVGSAAYAFRDGNRCEGMYRLQLSGGSNRLVLHSLTSGRSTASLADQPDLHVSWPPLPAGIRLRISVVPLGSPLLYRMDTEADGTAGLFHWPATIVRGLFSTYRNLGVIAFYLADGQTVYVACSLGEALGAAPEALQADVLSLEPLRRLEVYSRGCTISKDCDSPEAGSLVAALPGRDRDGTFTLRILSPSPGSSDFYSLRFSGQLATAASPPIATSIILRAMRIPTQAGSQE